MIDAEFGSYDNLSKDYLRSQAQRGVLHYATDRTGDEEQIAG